MPDAPHKNDELGPQRDELPEMPPVDRELDAGLHKEANAESPGWILETRYNLARCLRWIARISNERCSGWHWIYWSLFAGIVPMLLGFWFSTAGHQWVSAVILSGVCVGLLWNDRWISAILAISLMIFSHSIVTFQLSRNYPEASAAILPQASDYWEQQKHWIETGENREYEISTWLPAHLQLFAGSTLYSFLSFGVLVFHDGLIQVDMMNYYNAQLSNISESSVVSVGLGWHIWSLMRGFGYLFLTVEIISLALSLFAIKSISSRRIRITRWSLGIGFLLLDCTIKLFAVAPVRETLFRNLQ